MFSSVITKKSEQLLKALRNKKLKISTAESCTGGLLSVALTEIPGSSEVFERGFVTYSNESKIELLTVPTFFIDEFGAVSRETAIAMAEGTLLMSKAQIGISITGVAGPDGGTETKPVGTVFIACAYKDQNTIYAHHVFKGDRSSIRQQTVEAALDFVLRRMDGESVISQTENKSLEFSA
ncbi:MAG: CinA-like protein [Rickettsiaceae bacterium]|jgi:nicotinamide-nucleotide amidase|nr:CinA-like protein [Rickettsiaceae bacterium]